MIARILALAGLLMVAAARPLAAQEDDLPAAAAELAPVDLNRASLEELLEVPGLDAETARRILEWRVERGPIRSLGELAAIPGLTPARLAELESWLYVEEVALPSAARGARRLEVLALRQWRATGLRSDLRISGAGSALGLVARWRTSPTAPAGASAITGVLRWRAARGLSLILGDMAPARGAGLGLSLRSGFGGASRVESVGRIEEGLFALAPGAPLDRSVPAAESRRLRGVAIGVGSAVSIGLFDYHAGSTVPVSAAGAAIAPLRVAVAELGESGWPGERITLRARAAAWRGRLWPGAEAAFGPAGSGGRFEWAADPDGHHRAAILRQWRPGRGVTLQAWHGWGAPEFVSPLAGDSETEPADADSLSGGRNAGGRRSGLLARARLNRRVALEAEAGVVIDPATARRVWERRTSRSRLRFDLIPATGWSVALEGRLDDRASPGPSEVAEAPWRRPAGRLLAGWERGERRLRVEWRADLTLERARSPVHPGALLTEGRLFSIRGRWPLKSGFWIGGGMARFDLPSSALALIGEERPAGISAGVTIRGRGRRDHLAAGFTGGHLRAGFYVTAETRTDGVTRREGGVLIQIRLPGSPRMSGV